MKRIIQSVAGATALLAMVACGGGSDEAAGVGRLSVDGLTPLNGSDSIIGTWVGAADFTEVGTSDDYVETYTGSRMTVVQVPSNGTGGYELLDCNGDNSSVTYSIETNELSALGRDFIVTNFNEMTGKNSGLDSREWAYGNSVTAEEDWDWVKLSNSTGNIGTVVTNYSVSVGSTDTEADLVALCRESVLYSDTEGYSWATQQNSGAVEYNNSTSKFEVQIDSDGWKSAYVALASINEDSDTGTIGMNVQDASPEQYKVVYSSTGTGQYGAYTFNGVLTVAIPE
jgi:hypothetical protein